MLVVLALMVVGTGALGAALLSHTTTAGNRLVDGILPAQRDALRLESALLDQETGVRGYLLADEPALLEPYERGVTNETTAARRLGTVLDDDGVREDLAAVQEAARIWRSEFAAPAIASVENGSTPPSLQAGKDRFDEVRRRITAQQARLDRIQAEARTTFGEARSQRDHILLAIVVAFLLAAPPSPSCSTWVCCGRSPWCGPLPGASRTGPSRRRSRCAAPRTCGPWPGRWRPCGTVPSPS